MPSVRGISADPTAASILPRAAETLAAYGVDRSPFTEATCVALRVENSGTRRVRDALDASDSWQQVARSGEVVGWVRVEG